MNEEIWVLVFHNLYEASSEGNIRRNDKFHRRPNLSPATNTHGYMHVCLCRGGKRTFKYVHQLVAEAFLGECPRDKQVNHKDTNKSNNTPSNLEYVTQQENLAHAHKLGLIGTSPRSCKLSPRASRRYSLLFWNKSERASYAIPRNTGHHQPHYKF